VLIDRISNKASISRGHGILRIALHHSVLSQILPDSNPRLSAAHRRRLAEIKTVNEEMAEKQRVAASLETQLSELGQRMNPWEKQAIHDRQMVKRHLAELIKEGPEHVEQLLAVANEDEQPWLKMYSARKEPMLALQAMVNAADALDEPKLRPLHGRPPVGV
jgi:uncharacterized coiled-coil protein SlyX